jgi:ATP adenylyltransferase
MAYIKGAERHSSCFLCEKPAADDDEANLILGRGTRVFALLNLFPYNTGHLMVAPYRHVGELDDITHDEMDELWRWVRLAIAAHRRTTHPQGFNVGLNLGEVAGAGVPGHLHIHIVPRWGGDTNFMPVVAHTKVLPEMLADTYRTLRPAFDELA